MATLTTILSAFKTRLETISGLKAYDTLPGNVNQLPAALVEWEETDYHQAMVDGLVSHTFKVRVLVAPQADTQAQTKLLGYLAPAGSGSVKAAIEGGTPARTLGETVPATVVVTRADRAMVYEYGGQKFLGAEWTVELSDTGV